MSIELEDNPVVKFYLRCVKHLQHLDLSFSARENPYDTLLHDRACVIDELVSRFSTFGILVDPARLQSQDYLNYLHQLYFDNSSANLDRDTYWQWSHVHDLIHVLESINGTRKAEKSLILNYRNLAGLLYEKFDRKYLKYAVTEIPKGTCFLREQELGKDPVIYYNDGEKSDIELIKRICKPWVNLIPTLNIAVDDIVQSELPRGFEQWFAPFRDRWIEHWNQHGWQPWETRCYIPIGTVSDIDSLIDCFRRKDYPLRIRYEMC